MVERMVKELRNRAAYGDSRLMFSHDKLSADAADRIEALEARCRELERERDEWRDRPHRHLDLYGDADGDLHSSQAHAQKLAEALELFQGYGCPVCSGDCGSANPPVYSCPMIAAHAALSLTPTSALSQLRDVVREAVLKEREECAMVADDVWWTYSNDPEFDGCQNACATILAAIRARKETGE